MCPFRHCLDRSISLNNCHKSIYICKANIDSSLFLENLGFFMSVAQRVNRVIYFEFLIVCTNAHQPMSPEMLFNILITPHIHSPCHISLAVQQFLVMKQTVA